MCNKQYANMFNVNIAFLTCGYIVHILPFINKNESIIQQYAIIPSCIYIWHFLKSFGWISYIYLSFWMPQNNIYVFEILQEV